MEPPDADPDDDSGARPGGSTGAPAKDREVKPFIPVSSEKDLMKVLDMPMG